MDPKAAGRGVGSPGAAKNSNLYSSLGRPDAIRLGQRRFGSSRWEPVAAGTDEEMSARGFALAVDAISLEHLDDGEREALVESLAMSAEKRDEDPKQKELEENLLARCPRWSVPPLDFDVAKDANPEEGRSAAAAALRAMVQHGAERGIHVAEVRRSNARGGLHAAVDLPLEARHPDALRAFRVAIREVARAAGVPLIGDFSDPADRPLVVLDDSVYRHRPTSRGRMFRLPGSSKGDGEFAVEAAEIDGIELGKIDPGVISHGLEVMAARKAEADQAREMRAKRARELREAGAASSANRPDGYDRALAYLRTTSFDGASPSGDRAWLAACHAARFDLGEVQIAGVLAELGVDADSKMIARALADVEATGDRRARLDEDSDDWLDHAERVSSTQLPEVSRRHACHVSRAPHEQWSELRPLEPADSAEPEPFPAELLPGWAANFVLGLSVELQQPIDLPALLVLPALAGAVQRQVDVDVAGDGAWTEPTSLFTMPGCASATRKTATAAQIAKPVREAEQLLTEEAREVRAAALAKAALRDTEMKQIKRQGPDGDADRLAELLVEAAASPIPPEPRLLCDNITPEGLLRLMHQQGGCMAMLDAEGAIISIIGGRYSSGGEARLDELLKGHAGDAIYVDRVDAERSLRIDAPRLSLGIATQPARIEELTQIGGAGERGMLGRFIFSIPPETLGKRLVNPPSMPREVREAYKKRMFELWAQPAANPRVTLHLSDDALSALWSYQAWIEPQLAAGRELASIRETAGKAAGLAVRLAAIFHTAEGRPGYAIDRGLVERGITISKWSLASAKRVLVGGGAKADAKDARRVLDIARERVTDNQVALRELQRLAGMHRDSRGGQQFKRAVALLCDHGYAKVVEGGHDSATPKTPRRVLLLRPPNTLCPRDTRDSVTPPQEQAGPGATDVTVSQGAEREASATGPAKPAELGSERDDIVDLPPEGVVL